MTDATTQAAELLLAVRAGRSPRLARLPETLRPADQHAAYAIQRKVAASFSGIGGWKVGSPGPDGPVNCGPLPLAGVVASGAALRSALRGIEAEIAFLMAKDLPPRATPYSREDVIAAIASAHPAIEMLDCRYVDPDEVDPLSNLADTLAHGGFVYGAPVVNWHGVDFAREKIEQSVNGTVTKKGTGNPAGDMIRLMVWLANEGAVWAGGLKAGQYVTCGSWTGKELVPAGAAVAVKFSTMGDVFATFTD